MEFALYLLEEGLKEQLEEKKCIAKNAKLKKNKSGTRRKCIYVFRTVNKKNILGLKKVINYIKLNHDK